MEIITSRDNALYRHLQGLVRSGSYKEGKRTLLEGIHLAKSYISQGGAPNYVIAKEDAYQYEEVRAFLTHIDKKDLKVFHQKLFSQLSSVANGVGLMCEINIPIKKLPAKITSTCLILDRIQDPGNVGAILRTAAVAGIKQVFCLEETAQVWSPKVLRAAMGAHFLMDIFEGLDENTLLKCLAIPMLLTDVHQGVSIYDADLTQPTAWVFGNEGSGIAQTLKEKSHICVTIPKMNNDNSQVDSLNVAAAAAICLFEQLRQCDIKKSF